MGKVALIKKAVTTGLDAIKEGQGNDIVQELKTNLTPDFSGLTSLLTTIDEAVGGITAAVVADISDGISNWLSGDFSSVISAIPALSGIQEQSFLTPIVDIIMAYITNGAGESLLDSLIDKVIAYIKTKLGSLTFLYKWVRPT